MMEVSGGGIIWTLRNNLILRKTRSNGTPGFCGITRFFESDFFLCYLTKIDMWILNHELQVPSSEFQH